MMGNEGGGRAACSTTYGEQTGACGSHLALDQLAPRERPYSWSEASLLGSSCAAETVETEGTSRIRRQGPEPRRTLSNGRPPACRDHEGQVLLHRHSREGPRGVREVLHNPPRDEGARPKHR